VEGKTLVNNDHPQVIEIWNNVFIQFNRLKDGSLEPLPARHVDTGMGLERLVRVLQGKQSNYDTDIFSGTIKKVEKITGKKYNSVSSESSKAPSTGGGLGEVAFRVIADHIRAISFTIADGQLPSNTGAGYVIRRILRRAVRYYYSYLDFKQPLLNQLVADLALEFKYVFPELYNQAEFVAKVIKEEEESFLKTLEKGLKRFAQIKYDIIKKIIVDTLIKNNYQVQLNDHRKQDKLSSVLDIYLPELNKGIDIVNESTGYFPSIKDVGLTIYQFKIHENENISIEKILRFLNNIVEKDIRYDYNKRIVISGSVAFELLDTYGFPFDLTKLIAKENDFLVDENGFQEEMQKQKVRSRAATAVDAADWIILKEGINKFVGYDCFTAKSEVLKYRKVKIKGREAFQIVLDSTPFYAESGGQVGDTGVLIFDDEEIEIYDTKRDNDLIVHFANRLPLKISDPVIARINILKRAFTTYNHTATHLLHAALRKILGVHVTQKGSLVNDEHLRFDFSHLAKVTYNEIRKIEILVNEKIRENISVITKEMSKDAALKLGALALFGEKYGDLVRVVIIDPEYSVELCGGTHANATGQLGLFKIISESAVAAGTRRIEAITGYASEEYINRKFDLIDAINEKLKHPIDITKAVETLQVENVELKKHLEVMEARQLVGIRNELLQKDEIINGVNFVGDIVEVGNADALKKLCLDLKNHLRDHLVVLCANIGGKPFVAVGIAETVVAAKNLDAGKIIKEHIAPLIKGGGGGQKTLATAGGQDAGNLDKVIAKVKSLL
jgi:alanyl-tRNA synthetase